MNFGVKLISDIFLCDKATITLPNDASNQVAVGGHPPLQLNSNDAVESYLIPTALFRRSF